MSEKPTYERWSILTLFLTAVVLTVFAAFTAYIDPFFHYHGPLQDYEYPLNDERHQNDGILRNFEYSGLITGTSMTQNFKTSEAEALFGVPFIKVPFAGASYKEIDRNLRRGFSAGKDIDYIIRGLDFGDLRRHKDYCRTDFEYPTYLYNDDPFDDVNYILNKSVLLKRVWFILKYTKSGHQTTSFDEYSNWNDRYTFGAEAVLSSYSLGPAADAPISVSEADFRVVQENIRQNVTGLADEHPETVFYIFFTPYSICFWDERYNAGKVDWNIDIMQAAVEELLKHPNIKLHCFYTNFEMICDLNNYKDSVHYGEWVNSWMLEQMYNGNYLLTEDNYLEHLAAMRKFYISYDYASLHR